MINDSNSSLNDIMSSVDDDPMMRQMKAKLAQINQKFPDMGESSIQEEQMEEYKDNENNNYQNSDFDLMDAVDADENFYLSQQFADKSQHKSNNKYKQEDYQNEIQNSKSKQMSFRNSQKLGKSNQNEEVDKEEAILKKMRQKLKEQQAKVPQSKGGTKPFQKKEFNSDLEVKNILKRHNEKLQEIQRKNEDIYVKEAVDKMKAKKVKQNLTYYDAEKEKQWVDVRSKTGTAGKIQNEKYDNEKTAGKIANQIEFKLKGQRPPPKKAVESKVVSDKQSVSTKNQFSVNIGAGVKSEREKAEMAQKKKIQSMATSTFSRGPGLGDMQRLQKLKEKERQIQQKEREKLLADQAKKFIKEGQDFTEGKNNVIKGIQQSKEKNVQDPKEAKKQQILLAEKKRIDERNELDQEEIKRLKVQLRQLKEDGQILQKTYKEVEDQKNKVMKKVKVYEKHPAVICLGDGQYTSFSLVPQQKEEQSMASTSIGDNSDVMNGDDDVQEDEENDKRSFNQEEQEAIMAMSVVEKLVTKLDDIGKDLNDLFQMIDTDGDQLLTIEEIQKTLPQLEIDDFYQEDIDELIKILDQNSDGLIDEQEFVQALEAKLQQQKAYRKIMGNTKADPQELQLRTLDMQIRAKYVIRNFKKEKAVASVKDNKYKKLINLLKKEEENYQKRQNLKQKVDIQQLERELNLYQNKHRQVLDDKDKLVVMQHERSAEIMDNIRDLLQKLNLYTEKVVTAKLELQQIQENYQQIALKEIAYDQIKDRINHLKREREQDIQAQKARREIQLKQKAGMQTEHKKRLITVNETVNAALLVQKIVRGWRERVKARKRRELWSGSARLIGKAYTLKKRERGILAGKNALVNAFRGMQELGLAGIRQKYLNIEKEQASQKFNTEKLFQNYIRMGRNVIYKNIDVEKEIEEGQKAQQEFDLKQQEFLFKEEDINKGDQAITKLDHTDEEVEEQNEKSVHLKIQIQDKWGKIINQLQNQTYNQQEYNKDRKLRVEELNFYTQRFLLGIMISKLNQQSCMICQKNKANRLCYECQESNEQYIYCNQCFNEFHLNYQNKNHLHAECEAEYINYDDHKTEVAKEKERFQRVNDYLKEKINDINSQFIYRDNQYLNEGYLDERQIKDAIRQEFPQLFGKIEKKEFKEIEKDIIDSFKIFSVSFKQMQNLEQENQKALEEIPLKIKAELDKLPNLVLYNFRKFIDAVGY